MTPAVRMTDVAKACGVTHSTVSRALRNHPSIPAVTRLRIRQVAESLGFRPDPKLSLLMAQVRQGRSTSIQSTLGLVHVAPVPAYPDWPDTHRSGYIRGIKERADALGYGVDSFHLGCADLKGSDLERIFRTRRIQGAVLIDGSSSTSELGIDWSIAAWATVGFFSENPPLHAAAADYATHARLCFEHLRVMGCRRIGFVQSQAADEKIGHLWLAGYAAIAIEHGQPPLFFVSPDDLAGFALWLASEKPDGLISHSGYIAQLLEQSPPSPRIALVNLGTERDSPRKRGVIENAHAAGASAVDLVVGQMLRGERGLPDFEKRVLVRGHWSGVP